MRSRLAMEIDELAGMVGREIGMSGWHGIDQKRIDAYADVSGDRQFIHVDPDRAAATPFGGTVAHGFLTVALLPVMAREAQPDLDGLRMSVNYGFDRLRFVSPVAVDSRVRGRFTLASLDEIASGEIALAWDVTVEIEGQDRPALVARWLNRRYLEGRD